MDAAENAARSIAKAHGTVVAITGPVDFVTDGVQSAKVTGGSEIMPMVTALGCAQTALMGAYAASGPAFDAALATLAHFKVAGRPIVVPAYLSSPAEKKDFTSFWLIPNTCHSVSIHYQLC